MADGRLALCCLIRQSCFQFFCMLRRSHEDMDPVCQHGVGGFVIVVWCFLSEFTRNPRETVVCFNECDIYRSLCLLCFPVMVCSSMIMQLYITHETGSRNPTETYTQHFSIAVENGTYYRALVSPLHLCS